MIIGNYRQRTKEKASILSNYFPSVDANKKGKEWRFDEMKFSREDPEELRNAKTKEVMV